MVFDKERAVRLALTGDAEALSALYVRYKPQVEAWLAGRQGQATEDKTDLVMLRMFELLARGSGAYDAEFQRKFTAWLRRIADNVLMVERRRHMRHSGRYPQVPIEGPCESDLDATLRSRDAGPPTVAFQRELLARIHARVEALPSMYRDAVEQYYFEGKSFDEIAKGLKVSSEVVRQRLARARERLRARLRDLARTTVKLAVCR